MWKKEDIDYVVTLYKERHYRDWSVTNELDFYMQSDRNRLHGLISSKLEPTEIDRKTQC